MIRYFAEFLPRLKTISVCVEYPPSNVVSLHTNNAGNEVIIVEKQDYVQISLTLPVESAPDFQISVSGVAKDGCLVFRLPIEPNKVLLGSKERARDTAMLTDKDSMQWSAKRLRGCKDVFVCGQCHSVLVPLASVRRIDPMPSEFWSEMMEFWHCHRPSDDSAGSYSAVADRFSRFRPGKQNLIIGPYYVMLNPGDFLNMEMKKDVCVCSKCQKELGVRDSSTGNCKVQMWNMAMEKSGGFESYAPYLQAYSVLLDSVSSTAVRYYVVESGGRRLLVWCFSFGLQVVLSGAKMEDSLKLLYKEEESEISAFVSKSGAVQYDTIELDGVCYNSFVEELRRTNGLLPTSQRGMMGWRVGYLAK